MISLFFFFTISHLWFCMTYVYYKRLCQKKDFYHLFQYAIVV